MDVDPLRIVTADRCVELSRVAQQSGVCVARSEQIVLACGLISRQSHSLFVHSPSRRSLVLPSIGGIITYSSATASMLGENVPLLASVSRECQLTSMPRRSKTLSNLYNKHVVTTYYLSTVMTKSTRQSDVTKAVAKSDASFGLRASLPQQPFGAVACHRHQER